MRIVALSLLLLTAAAPACLNDRDTIVREVASPPDVITALTGRFERLPPAYYQARVNRITRIARPTASDLDDLGVALDRLGRDDEALAAMARKAAMPGLDREQRYRLHANRGTFLAHRALATKAPAAALKPAIADIAEAIRLKPDAHFGREGVQLRVLRWIHRHRTDPKTPNLGFVLAREGDSGQTATALAGLIQLGNAWESPDVVAAIGYLASESASAGQPEDRFVRMYRRAGIYAGLRFDELKAAGRRPMDAEAESFQGQQIDSTLAPEREEIARQWRAERNAAETRTRLRAQYVEGRIDAGSHPDTDPEFDAGWHEPMASAAKILPDRVVLSPAHQDELNRADRLIYGIAFGVVAFGSLATVALVRRNRAREIREREEEMSRFNARSSSY